MEKLNNNQLENKLTTNIYREEAGEPAQWLRGLVAFPKDLDLIPRTHVVVPKYPQRQFQGI